MINEDFIKTSLEYFLNNVLQHSKIIKKYEDGFEKMSLSHPVYRNNWRVGFLDKHRYMNWILYTFLKNAKNKKHNVLFNHDIFNKDFIVYTAIDGASTFYLWELIQEELSNDSYTP